MISGLFYTWVRLFRVLFLKKIAFCLLAPPKQMSFLTISNENVLFKTQGTRLGAIIAPNKGLEKVLDCFNLDFFVLSLWCFKANCDIDYK